MSAPDRETLFGALKDREKIIDKTVKIAIEIWRDKYKQVPNQELCNEVQKIREALILLDRVNRGQGQANHFVVAVKCEDMKNNYTMKSLILAQDER